MFSTTLSDLRLTDRVGDEMFPKIQGESYNNDFSFLATMRALLTPHIPQDYDGTIRLHYLCDSVVCNNSDPDFVWSVVSDRIGTDSFNKDLITIYGFERETNALSIIKDKFLEQHPTYVPDEKTSRFFSTLRMSVDALFFVDAENHNTFIFVDSFSVSKNHVLQYMMPRYFKWWWTDKPTEKEAMLCASLFSHSGDSFKWWNDDHSEKVRRSGYVTIINEIADNYGYSEMAARVYLSNFVKEASRVQVENIENRIDGLTRDITSYQNSIRQMLKTKYDLEIQRMGIRMHSSENDDCGMVSYFKAHPSLDIISCYDYVLDFGVYTDLELWNEDLAERVILSDESFAYDHCQNWPTRAYKKFLEDIFINRTLIVQTCARYTMDIRDSMRGYEGWDDYRYKENRIPNPHIYHFGCTGAYSQQFDDAILAGEYTAAIEAAVSSAKSIAFNDPSFDHFLEDLYEFSDIHFIRDANGNLLSPEEVINMYNEED